MNGKRFVRSSDSEADTFAYQLVDAIMIFRRGIRPEWEDPINSTGAELRFTFRANVFKNPRLTAMLDEVWNNLVLGVVGATIEPNDIITGVRLVDKMTASGIKVPFIRFEVWFQDPTTTKDPNYQGQDKESIIVALQQNIEKCMLTKLDGKYVPENTIWALPVDRREHC